ncbi:NUDIX hydrolase [Sphingomonas sp. ID0503]|uniref:NUDIX hydrolase n=1 Tax=Sphingomonas sp. ID0503 TaxID=3399691 RepID=UPI003AFA35CF
MADYNVEGQPSDATLQPAGSIVILREAAEGLEVLMLQRSPTMAFAPNALVFPGGRVDAADVALAKKLTAGLTLEDAAARVAAIRETVEECGLAIGFSPPPPPERARRLSDGLAEGRPFETALASSRLEIDLFSIKPYARWQPGLAERSLITRCFDARIYVARAPSVSDITVDPSEISAFRWASPLSILRCCAEGSTYALFPTRRILERIAKARTFAEVITAIPADPFRAIVPWTKMVSGEMHLCIPNDHGYPVTAELWSTVQAEFAKQTRT